MTNQTSAKPAGKSYYLNAAFDLELGGYSTHNVYRSALEMGTLFLPMCTRSDNLLLDIDIQDNYLEYLQGKGLVLPSGIIKCDSTPDLIRTDGVAWGWNTQVTEILRKYNVNCAHPDLSVVRDVNNRKFCNDLGTEFELGVPGSSFFSTLEEFSLQSKVLKEFYPLVVKPAFGGSGFGLIVVQSPDHTDAELEKIKTYCDHGGAVLEPWCNRKYDLSTNFDILPDGSVTPFRYQRLFSNEYGAFFGIYLAPADHLLDKWKDKLARSAAIIAGQLKRAHYYGPAGLDSFVYTDRSGRESLAAVIEINARHVMSYVAHAVRDQIAPGKFCYFRMFSKKRCKLPATYETLREQLGTIEKKVMVITPLRVRHNTIWQQPSRNAFFIHAEIEEELFEIDSRLRQLFM